MKSILLSIVAVLLLSTSELLAQYAVPIKIDEFGNTNCDDYRARMDHSLTELSMHPNAKGYVFVYEGNLKEWVKDKNTLTTKGWRLTPSEVGLAKDLIAYFKTHLAFRNFAADRIVFVNAGFRKTFVVEVWLVPEGAEPPTASPTLSKIKQRRRVKRAFSYCGEM